MNLFFGKRALFRHSCDTWHSWPFNAHSSASFFTGLEAYSPRWARRSLFHTKHVGLRHTLHRPWSSHNRQYLGGDHKNRFVKWVWEGVRKGGKVWKRTGRSRRNAYIGLSGVNECLTEGCREPKTGIHGIECHDKGLHRGLSEAVEGLRRTDESGKKRLRGSWRGAKMAYMNLSGVKEGLLVGFRG